ncbi:MAG: NUDIX hydrolase [Deltaproteobacteria bacterium]|nr:NUDIX hydrolase [Deltaproteobacteria bacterium]
MSSRHDLGWLRKRYGKFPHVEAVLASGDFAPLRGGGGRRSEVAMAIRRPSGGILLQTKAFYPPGTFRLPTGGIKEGEDVEHALLREVHEESNLDVEIERLVAVIDHSAVAGKAPFRSYMFLLREIGGTLKVNDPDEKISGWDERDVVGLERAARELRNLAGTWRRWGQFRAVALEVLAGAVR